MATKKGKPKKPTATQRERKRVQQFIRRAEKRGYLFDEEFKEGLKSAKYQTLKSYTPEKLYKNAEYVVKRNILEYGRGEIISGSQGRRLERKVATEKARITQLVSYQQKHGGHLYTVDNRLYYTKDPDVAIKATRENIRKGVEKRRSDIDRDKERQQEEIRRQIDKEISKLETPEAEDLADLEEIEDSYEDEDLGSFSIQSYNTLAKHEIEDIDNQLSNVYYDRNDLTAEYKNFIDDIEEKLDNGEIVTQAEYEKLEDIYNWTYGYTRGLSTDYEYESEQYDLGEQPELGLPFPDLTEEDYEVYGRVLEMIQTSDEKGAEILDKILANAISQFGEEEVIKTLASMSEDDIADMQYAIHYETDINGGRIFSKIAKNLYGITGERVSNEMNREIGRAMDTM